MAPFVEWHAASSCATLSAAIQWGGYYLGFLGMEFGKHLLVALHDSKVEQHVL